MNVMGIVVYLLVVFVPALVFDGVVLATDVIDYSIRNTWGLAAFLGLLLLPGLAGYAAVKISDERPENAPTLWLARPGAIALAIVGPFAVVLSLYLIEYALGYSRIEWDPEVLLPQAPAAAGEDTQLPAPPLFILALGIIAQTLVALLLYAPFCLATEYGWRGYLLPQLLPSFGRLRAYLIVGFLWGAWFAPLFFMDAAGLLNPMDAISAAVRAIAFCVIFGALLGECARRTNGLVVGALVAGGFLGHSNGVFEEVFYSHAPPMTGPLGLISLGLWSAVTALVYVWPARAADVGDAGRVPSPGA